MIRNLCFLAIFLVIVPILSCSDDSVKSKVNGVMHDFVDAYNQKDTDDMLDLIYPRYFKLVKKKHVAAALLDNYWGRRRRIKVKKMRKLYGPYEEDGRQFALAEFELKRGRLFGRNGIVPFIFASDNGEDWYLVPGFGTYGFYYDSYRYFRYWRDYDDHEFEETHFDSLNIVPKAVLQQMDDDYIPGSAD